MQLHSRRRLDTVAAGGDPNVNVNHVVAEHLSANDRVALFATRIFGSMPTFYLFFVWALLPVIPFFRSHQTFILYISAGIIQLVALPLLSVGQNLLGRHSETRAEADFAVNQKAFADTEAILAQLKTLDERTLALAQVILRNAGAHEAATK
jgi:uncharacterized membrane protein